MGECQPEGKLIKPLNSHLIACIIDAPQRPPILQSKVNSELMVNSELVVNSEHVLSKQDQEAARLSWGKPEPRQVLWFCGCSAIARQVMFGKLWGRWLTFDFAFMK